MTEIRVFLLPLEAGRVGEFEEVRQRFAPIAEDVPFLKLMVLPLMIHRLQLLIVGDHRRGEAEAFR